MKNYWTCSKFADWLRGTMKPNSETSRGWATWKKEAQAKHPFRYWLAEEGLDHLQDFIRWPIDRLYSVKYYVNNRWVSKTHVLSSNLKKGDWHEFDTRLLHSMFDSLIDFVEIEQAWHHIAWDKEAREKYKAPFYSWGWFRWRTWRCPQAGLDYLDWASKLTMNDDWVEKDDPKYGQPTGQAIGAQEILALYNWWKVVRPARVEPMEASGWSALCDSRRETHKEDGFMWEDRTDEERAQSRSILDECHRLEEQYEKEDEEMMIRLVKLRGHLWT